MTRVSPFLTAMCSEPVLPLSTHPTGPTTGTVALGAGARKMDASGGGILFIEAGVDITNPETLTPELFKGVTQVIAAAALGDTAGVAGFWLY